MAFCTAFFPRIFEAFGFPAAINFVHFATVPFTFFVVLFTVRTTSRRQNIITEKMLLGIFLLLTATVVSALLNEAGAINAVLSFILLVEPFIFILAIVANPMTRDRLKWFRSCVYGCFFLHLAIVFFQKYVLKVDGWDHLSMTGADKIQGVFFLSGAGHVVGSSVSLSFAIYYFIAEKPKPLWFRISLIAAAFWNIVLADGKQVLFVFMLAMLLLILIRLNNIVAVAKYGSIALFVVLLFYWGISNLEALSAFNTWLRPDIYGLNGEATLLKTVSLRIIPTHYDSILNGFFGLGPGHTVGRLGGWMLKNYADLLKPLGSTTHIATTEVWQATGASWLGSQSSMFSPLFGWAGIWGDLGIFGLGSYLYLASVLWQDVCKNDFTRFLLLTVMFFGFIMSQMEEPGYMLSVAMIIGIEYQKSLYKSE